MLAWAFSCGFPVLWDTEFYHSGKSLQKETCPNPQKRRKDHTHYYLFQNMNLEFEYLFVNDQITVDKIMGQARRKKVWEGTLGEVQIVAPIDSYILKDYEKPGMKRLDFASHAPNARVYGMIHQGEGGQVTKVIFEPNDKILHHIRQRSPRKVVL